MTDAVPTLIVEVPASAVPDMMERITAFLLHHQYGFMQIFNPGDALPAFEIFPAVQALPGVHLLLHVPQSGASTSLLHVPSDAATAPPETVTLIQRLLEVFNTPSGDT